MGSEPGSGMLKDEGFRAAAITNLCESILDHAGTFFFCLFRGNYFEVNV